MNKNNTHVILAVLLMIFLSGCVAAFITGAATGGLIISDNRSFTTINDDNTIYYQINNNFVRDPTFDDCNIRINSFNHVVLLTGQTPNKELKVKAEKVAHSQANVSRVYNEITIGNNSNTENETQDVWITSQVRSKMITTSGLRSGSIKVSTQDSVVYLMGIVSKQQADMAVSIARKVKGVKKVVKVFQYI